MFSNLNALNIRFTWFKATTSQYEHVLRSIDYKYLLANGGIMLELYQLGYSISISIES